MITLLDLPSVYVCKLLGYLDWETKLCLIDILPQWAESLHSSEAWLHITNTASQDQLFSQPTWSSLGRELTIPEVKFLRNCDNAFRNCITEYGQYFQSCKLVLEFEDVYMCRMDQTLLCLVLEHCHSLQNLVVHFPRGLGFKILQCIGDYRFMLNRIPRKCPRIRTITIQILEYSPVLETCGVSELFQLDDMNGVVPRLTELDFSYIHAQNIPKADFLHHFTGLKTLKAADHLLDQEIVLALFTNGLKDLYVSNNSLTRDFNSEYSVTDLEWEGIAQRFPDVRVHYNYSCAQILPWTFKRNPLVKTLVLDSLFNYITGETLEAIGKMFPELRLFAQLSSEWSYQHYDDILDTESMYSLKLLANTPKLEIFVTSLTIGSSDLLSMAEAASLKTIVVNREEIFYDFDYVEDQRTYLDKRMTIMLGKGWQPLLSEEFPKYSLSLLG